MTSKLTKTIISVRRQSRRNFTNKIATILVSIAVLCALFFLLWILYTILSKGLTAITWQTFT